MKESDYETRQTFEEKQKGQGSFLKVNFLAPMYYGVVTELIKHLISIAIDKSFGQKYTIIVFCSRPKNQH